MGSRNVLIGVTGSVATIKLIPLIDLLQGHPGLNIKVVSTQNALHFFDRSELTTRGVELHLDQDEWDGWKAISDPVLHIELRKWADIMVISPLDANTLGKLSVGMCDNLLTCIVRAWDIVNKPLLFCPAMNTFMFNHPVTEKSLKILQSFGYILIPTVEKRLACGDTGDGAMAEVETISRTVMEYLKRENDL